MNPRYQYIRRINIVGTSGSGKSTFAQRLAAVMDVPHVEMDCLYWGPNWTEPTDEVFVAKIEAALAGDSWVIDGNYTRTTPVKWKDVQMVVWLDFSFGLVMRRAISRALYRIITRRELWPDTGNRETFSKLFGKGSIVRWAYNTYDNNIRKYESIMADEKYAHITFARIKSPREANEFLKNFPRS